MGELKLAKRHVQRLEMMLCRLEKQERCLQQVYGERRGGSRRASDWKDAETLRAVLALVPAAPPAACASALGDGPCLN